MKHPMIFKKGLASFLIVCLCLCAIVSWAPMTACAFEETNLPAVSGASSIFLYHFESNQILMKRSSLATIAPASTVKIMTGLLALQRLEGRMDEYVTLTDEMLSNLEGYTVLLEKGMTVQIRDLLYGTICGGGNDAATALAVVCSGSVEAFVDEMNALALEWGCFDTYYTNPTGLDDPKMVTTLEDTVRLAKKAIENPLFLQMSSATNHSYTPQGADTASIFYNRNALISSFSAIGYQNKYAQGLNAGMTERGGHCVVTYANDGTSSYLCVVMGAVQTSSGILSYKIANTLLQYVLKNYSYRLIAEKGKEVCSTPVRLAIPQNSNATSELSCVLAEDVYGYLPTQTDLSEDLTYRYYLHQREWTAPISSDTVIGGVDIYLGDEWIATAKLIAAEEIPSSSLLVALETMKTVFLSRPILIACLTFVILLLLYLYFSSVSYKRKHAPVIAYKK